MIGFFAILHDNTNKKGFKDSLTAMGGHQRTDFERVMMDQASHRFQSL
jgi:hypothetical protein